MELATRPATFGEVFDLDALRSLFSLDVTDEDSFGKLIRCDGAAGVLVWLPADVYCAVSLHHLFALPLICKLPLMPPLFIFSS